ncbi:MAG: SH3 domain-containing protein [Hyphomicrobiaceae bacterium]|nr:SH3 domain-containing protein [Hyphomicrobiaceae bacterium]
MRLNRSFAILIGMSALIPAASARDPGEMDGARLSKAVAGATLHLESPLGLTLPIVFAPDGGMVGEAGGLTFFLGASRDKGRWWIAGDKLCKKWDVWFEAKTKCVWVRMEGNAVGWRHADGSTGRGLITARLPIETAAAASPQPEKKVPASLARAPAAPTRTAATPAPNLFGTGLRPLGKAPTAAPAAAGSSKSGAAEAGLPPQPASAGPVPPKPQLVSPRVAALATLDPARLVAAPPLPAPRPASPPPVTVARTASTTPGPALAVAPTGPAASASRPAATFRVVEVDAFDVLNVRSGPSEAFGVVATIPPNGRGVILTGRCVADWCPVRHLQRTGWVNSYYLEPEPRAVAARDRAASTYTPEVRMNLGAELPDRQRR